ncbi:MAG: glutamyl-tRNA reductase [Pseudomonadota bacterium]|nr:glutamyl-tRNA reductase [Pseudomonadota bacterium]
MQLLSFGLNHHSAPVQIRERVAFPESTLQAALRDLAERGGADEAAIISTCNRTEVYCRTDHPERAVAWLATWHGLSVEQLQEHLFQLEDEAAAAHAFRVAAGMDSMVLGEAQILGQVKQAVRVAGESGTLGWLLNKLFQQTFAVAKDVRTRTGIGSQSVSLAAAAIRLAGRVLGAIPDQSVLLVGAGEMMELVATHVAAHRPKALAVANRTLERAQRLATSHGGRAFTLAELPAEMAAFDIVIACTGAPLPIIGKGMMERVMRTRRQRPVVMIDLAVPRDVESEVGQIDDVFLYTVDDLGKLIQEGLDARQNAAGAAATIVDEQVSAFMQWLRNRELVPVIRQLRGHAETYRRSELERAQRALARGDDPTAVLDALSQGLMNKFLHHPTQLLQQAEPEEQGQLIRWLPRLFPVSGEE